MEWSSLPRTDSIITWSARFIRDDKSVKCSIKFNQHRLLVSESWSSPQSPILRSSGLALTPPSQQQRPGTNKQLKGFSFYKYRGQWHLSMGGQSHHNTTHIPVLCHKLQSHTNKMIKLIFSSSDFLSPLRESFSQIYHVFNYQVPLHILSCPGQRPRPIYLT